MGFLLALDPGSQKVGAALLELGGRLVRRGVLSVLSLESDLGSFVGFELQELEVVVLGDGTHAAAIRARLPAILGRHEAPVEVDERESTLEARRLFYQEHPPGLLLRLLPRGLWPEPDVPLDGYAAEVLARRYLAQLATLKQGAAGGGSEV